MSYDEWSFTGKGARRMKSSEILEKAAEYIQENGWCQGRLEDEEGRVCALGAIYAVQGEALSYTSAAEGWLYRAMYGISPIIYNDHPSTTAEDVILSLKRATSLARKQGE